MDILAIVLSSSVVSGVVGAAVAGWFTLRSKRDEYANAYYKMILERRIAAYEQVEHLITSIKTAVVDSDQRPYHFLFSADDGYVDALKQVFGAMSNALWLSDQLYDLLRELNILIYSGTKGNAGLIDFGKTNYVTIAELRTNIERVFARDMLVLHDVPAFLKGKKPSDSYTPLARRG